MQRRKEEEDERKRKLEEEERKKKEALEYQKKMAALEREKALRDVEAAGWSMQKKHCGVTEAVYLSINDSIWRQNQLVYGRVGREAR